jgi:hypothetical protein
VTPTAATALSAVARLVALAVALQTVELLQLHRVAAADGVWRWQTLRREWQVLPRPLAWLVTLLLRPRPFVALLVLRLAAAVALGVVGGAVPVLGPLALPATLLATTILVQLRWRGTFNGGSDFMTLVILSALTVAAALPSNPTVAAGALYYIAVQTCTSYFLAGVAKLKTASWRDGRALRFFVATSIYDRPLWPRALFQSATATRLLGWATLLLECTFPLALLRPPLCLGYLAVAFCFHVGNARVFGLNRFVFAWAAAYPAVYFCSQLAAR